MIYCLIAVSLNKKTVDFTLQCAVCVEAIWSSTEVLWIENIYF